MNKILKKINAAVQLVLMAPVKLPAKALQIIKYVALGLGILESVTREAEDNKVEEGQQATEGGNPEADEEAEP